MAEAPEKAKARYLCIDIETARQDRTILREIGAYRPDLDARARIPGKADDLVPRLDDLTRGAAFVLDHNVVAFDQPALATIHRDLALHRLPVVDTLELSPIAFVENPCHRLVKDYKLSTTTRNNPIRDAELAYEQFLDERDALQARVQAHADEALCLHGAATLCTGGRHSAWRIGYRFHSLSMRFSTALSEMAERYCARGRNRYRDRVGDNDRPMASLDGPRCNARAWHCAALPSERTSLGRASSSRNAELR